MPHPGSVQMASFIVWAFISPACMLDFEAPPLSNAACAGGPGNAAVTANRQLRDPELHAHLQQQAAAAAVKGKEYGAKGWNLLKAGYASMASHVEHVARDNGYNVDLGALALVAQHCWWN